jgi:hypothetical protein
MYNKILQHLILVSKYFHLWQRNFRQSFHVLTICMILMEIQQLIYSLEQESKKEKIYISLFATYSSDLMIELKIFLLCNIKKLESILAGYHRLPL